MDSSYNLLQGLQCISTFLETYIAPSILTSAGSDIQPLSVLSLKSAFKGKGLGEVVVLFLFGWFFVFKY